MIKDTSITIEDADRDELTIAWDEENDSFLITPEDMDPVLRLSKDDAAAVIQFFRRYGVSA